MRFAFLVGMSLLVLSGPVSAAVMNATYTGKVWDVFYVFQGGDRGSEDDCPLVRRAAGVKCDSPGLHGREFTAVFTYDSATMERTQFPDPGPPTQDTLKAGPSNGLPVGAHSAGLTIDCNFCAPLTPTILGNDFFTVLLTLGLLQHRAADPLTDGNEAFIEISFGASGFSPPIDVLAAYEFSRVGSFSNNGLFSYSFAATADAPAFEFVGELEILTVSIARVSPAAAVPLPPSAWLMLSALGVLAALRRRAA